MPAGNELDDFFPPNEALELKAFDGITPRGIVVVRNSTVIGSGALASVVKAEWRRPGRSTIAVALKILFPLKHSDAACVAKELKYHPTLEHDNILAFIGTCTYGKRMIIVSQYMENGDLADYLERTDNPDRRRIVKEIAHGIQYMHVDAGVVHGDLNCKNVLIDADGTARLADFGLSTAIASTGADVTASGVRAKHTPPFAAPELFEDEARGANGKLRSKTEASDIYAFGMIVYQVFTRTMPWDGLKAHRIMKVVCDGARPIRPEGLASFSDHYWNLCEACWKHVPEDRVDAGRIVRYLAA